jgi:Calx-beta domain
MEPRKYVLRFGFAALSTLIFTGAALLLSYELNINFSTKAFAGEIDDDPEPLPDYSMDWCTLDAGTQDILTSGTTTLFASLGQPDASVLTADNGTTLTTLLGGFLPIEDDNHVKITKSRQVVPEPIGTVNIDVALTFPKQEIVSVFYQTNDGSALAGTDYNPTSGTLTFNPGEMYKQIHVDIIEDGDTSEDDQFTVSLSSPQNIQIGYSASTTVQILDGPFIEVVGAPIDFPTHSITPGLSETENIWIYNLGNAPLTFTGDGYNITGVNSSDFLLSFIGDDVGLSPTEVSLSSFSISSPSVDGISTDTPRRLPLLFNPTSIGLKYAVLEIATNAVNKPSYNIDLSGVAEDQISTLLENDIQNFDFREDKGYLQVASISNREYEFIERGGVVTSEWRENEGIKLRNIDSESIQALNWSTADLPQVISLNSDSYLTKASYYANYMNAPNNRNVPLQRLRFVDDVNVINYFDTWNTDSNHLWQSLGTPWLSEFYFQTFEQSSTNTRSAMNIHFDAWANSNNHTSGYCENVICNFDNLFTEQIPSSWAKFKDTSLYSQSFLNSINGGWSSEILFGTNIVCETSSDGLVIRGNGRQEDGDYCGASWKHKVSISQYEDKLFKITAKIKPTSSTTHPPHFSLRVEPDTSEKSVSSALEIHSQRIDGWDEFVPAENGTDYTFYWKLPKYKTVSGGDIDQVCLYFDTYFGVDSNVSYQDLNGGLILQSIEMTPVENFTFSGSLSSQGDYISPITSTDNSYPLLIANRWLVNSEFSDDSNASNDVYGYLFQIATDNSFSSIIQEIQTSVSQLDDSEPYIYAFPSKNLTVNQEYYWRVLPIDFFGQVPSDISSGSSANFTVSSNAFSFERGNFKYDSTVENFVEAESTANHDGLVFEPDPVGIHLRPTMDVNIPSPSSPSLPSLTITTWVDLQILSDTFGGSTRENTVIKREDTLSTGNNSISLTKDEGYLNLVNASPLSDFGVGFSFKLRTSYDSTILGYCDAISFDAEIPDKEMENIPSNDSGWNLVSYSDNGDSYVEAVSSDVSGDPDSLKLKSTPSVPVDVVLERDFDLTNMGINHNSSALPNMLYRLRFQASTDLSDSLAANEDIPTLKFQGAFKDSNGDIHQNVSLCIDSNSVKQYWDMDNDRSEQDPSTMSSSTSIASPEINHSTSNEMTQYDIFINAPVNHTDYSDLYGAFGIDECNGSGSSKAVITLDNVEISEINPENRVWMKTGEWTFFSNPYASGWEKVGNGTTGAVLRHEINYPETENDPTINDRLKISVSSGHNEPVGFVLKNILRKPETDVQGLMPGVLETLTIDNDDYEICSNSYDYRNRLLRVDVTLSSNVNGDSIPPLVVKMISNGFGNQFEVLELRKIDTESSVAVVPSGEKQVVSFYFQPQHYLRCLSGNDSTPSKRLDLSLTVEEYGSSGSVEKVINIEDVIIYEALISDLPSGSRYKHLSNEVVFDSFQESEWWDDRASLWPPVSQFRLHPNKDLKSYVLQPVDWNAVEEPRYSFGDHGLIKASGENGDWHLYGIFTLYNGFSVVEDPEQNPNADPLTLYDTYYGGLGHFSMNHLFPNDTELFDEVDGDGEPGQDGVPDPDEHGNYIVNYDSSYFTSNISLDGNKKTDDVFVDEYCTAGDYTPWAPTILAFDKYRMYFTGHTGRGLQTSPPSRPFVYYDSRLFGNFKTGNQCVYSSTPDDPMSWSECYSWGYPMSSCVVATNRKITMDFSMFDTVGIPRDINFVRCQDQFGGSGFQAVWVGYNEILSDNVSILETNDDPDDEKTDYDFISEDQSLYHNSSCIFSRFEKTLDDFSIKNCEAGYYLEEKMEYIRKNEEYKVFSLINPDSGRLDSQNESPYLVYDEETDLYYLAVTKDGDQPPNKGQIPGMFMDYYVYINDDKDGNPNDNGVKLVNLYVSEGSEQLDESVLSPLCPYTQNIPDPDSVDEMKLNLYDPIDFEVVDVTGGMTWQLGEAEHNPQMQIIVADGGGSSSYPPRLINIDLTTGKRKVIKEFSQDADISDIDVVVGRDWNAVSPEKLCNIRVLVADNNEKRITCYEAGTLTESKIEGIRRTKAEISDDLTTTLFYYDCSTLTSPIDKIHVSQKYEYYNSTVLKYMYFISGNAVYGGDANVFDGDLKNGIKIEYFNDYPNADSLFRKIVKNPRLEDPQISQTIFDVFEKAAFDPVGQTQKKYLVIGTYEIVDVGGEDTLSLSIYNMGTFWNDDTDVWDDIYIDHYTETSLASLDDCKETFSDDNLTDLDSIGYPRKLTRPYSYYPLTEFTDDPKMMIICDIKLPVFSLTNAKCSYIGDSSKFQLIDFEFKEDEMVYDMVLEDYVPRRRLPGSPQRMIHANVTPSVRVYWSSRDHVTGRLNPFTEDHYVGSVPFLAAELPYDTETESWGITHHSHSAPGGYGLNKGQWVPGISAPINK